MAIILTTRLGSVSFRQDEDSMRIVSWNVRQGGGGVRAQPMAAGLLALEPDVVALSEYRPLASAPLVSALRADGLEHVAATEPRRSANGVAVLARAPFHLPPSPAWLTELQRERWLEVDPAGASFTLLNAYVPPIRSGFDKPGFWRALLTAAEQSIHEEFAIVGDLNTGPHRIDEVGATFGVEDAFRELLAQGWVDAFRTLHGDVREYSHGARGVGQHRIDHAFLSPSLAPRLRACFYEHDLRVVERLSDHSPLVLDVDD
jgi:exodeoxyribonuclease-3